MKPKRVKIKNLPGLSFKTTIGGTILVEPYKEITDNIDAFRITIKNKDGTQFAKLNVSEEGAQKIAMAIHFLIIQRSITPIS